MFFLSNEVCRERKRHRQTEVEGQGIMPSSSGIFGTYSLREEAVCLLLLLLLFCCCCCCCCFVVVVVVVFTADFLTIRSVHKRWSTTSKDIHFSPGRYFDFLVLCAGDAEVKKRMAKTLRLHGAEPTNDFHPVVPRDPLPHPCCPTSQVAEGGVVDAKTFMVETTPMPCGAQGGNALSPVPFDCLDLVPPLQRSHSSLEHDGSQDVDLGTFRMSR